MIEDPYPPIPNHESRLSPKAVLFDAYGTLFDVFSISVLAEKLFPGHGQALAIMWRDKQIEYTRLVTTSNHGIHYRPFSALTRSSLIYSIKRIVMPLLPSGVSISFADEVEELLEQYQKLTPFPESIDVLHKLHAMGIRTGILSNGDAHMLHPIVKSAGLQGLLDHVISVDPIRKFKTHPDAYALGAKVCGLPASQILFVSCNSWDALAATWYGYQTLWVNRYQLPFEELGTQPTLIGNNLHSVFQLLDNWKL